MRPSKDRPLAGVVVHADRRARRSTLQWTWGKAPASTLSNSAVMVCEAWNDMYPEVVVYSFVPTRTILLTLEGRGEIAVIATGRVHIASLGINHANRHGSWHFMLFHVSSCYRCVVRASLIL
jgi:hypothetical protein